MIAPAEVTAEINHGLSQRAGPSYAAAMMRAVSRAGESRGFFNPDEPEDGEIAVGVDDVDGVHRRLAGQDPDPPDSRRAAWWKSRAGLWTKVAPDR
jgi:hypothetical protein